jgi:diamine N-acetyltransferase
MILGDVVEVSLRPVTKDNYEAICDLKVTEEQKQYVASNLWSLVEAAFNEGYQTRAIYLHDEPVGFFMWVYAGSHKISIWRFMVDQKFQQKNIGRTALQMLLSDMKGKAGLKEIEICYYPKNPVAKDFYASFGFVEVGLDDEGDDMLAVLQLV